MSAGSDAPSTPRDTPTDLSGSTPADTPAARRLTATCVMFLETVEQSGGPTTASAVLVRLGDRYVPHAARQRRTRQARNELRWLSDAGLLARVWVGPDAATVSSGESGHYEYQLTDAGRALLARARTRDPGPPTNTSSEDPPVAPAAVEPPAAPQVTGDVAEHRDGAPVADHRHPAKRRRKESNPDKCGAKTRSGGTCGLPAGHGNPDGNRSGRCSRHGGATPTGRAVAERQEQDKAAAKEATRLGIWDATRDVSPVEALVEQLQRAAGLTEALRLLLGEHAPDGTATTPEAQGLVRMYAAERDRLRELAAVCAKLGIEERRLQAEEGKVRALAAAVNGAIGDVPLTSAQQSALRAALRLRLLAAEGEAPDESARQRLAVWTAEAQAELDGLRRPVFVQEATQRAPELPPRSEPRRVSSGQQPEAIEVHPSVQQLRELEQGR